jgi:hypothetical protein
MAACHKGCEWPDPRSLKHSQTDTGDENRWKLEIWKEEGM